MLNRDRTGPLGRRSVAGRGRGRRISALGQSGSAVCTCPKCGYSEMHVRGVPCTSKKCPKCGTPMNGIFCS